MAIGKFRETSIIKSINNNAPKLLSPLAANEMAEALFYFTTALDEVVDAVFLAHNDPKFLTRECAEDLRLLQGTAQIVAEVSALQMIGYDDIPQQILGDNGVHDSNSGGNSGNDEVNDGANGSCDSGNVNNCKAKAENEGEDATCQTDATYPTGGAKP